MDRAAWIVVSISAAYLVASLVVGSLPGGKASRSADGYVAGDRTMGLVLMYFITGATIFSAFAFLGAPGWTYSRGTAGFYILGYGTLGFVPMYFLGPRAARLGRRFGFVTQAEMVAHRFSMPAIAGWMAALSTLGFVPYLALQMKGAGYILEEMTRGQLPSWVGAGVVYAVVTAYVLRSGVLGVGWTNTFQGLFMLILAWALGLTLPAKLYGGVGPMFDRLAEERPEYLTAPGLAPPPKAPADRGDAGGGRPEAEGGDRDPNAAADAEGPRWQEAPSRPPWSWGEYSAAVLVSILGFAMWPHLFMKAFTARSENTLRHTVILYPTFLIFLVPLFLLGYAGILYGGEAPGSPDQILPKMLMSLDLSPVVVGLFCAGALAASMSSGDAMGHAAASIAVRDGLVTAAGRDWSPAQQTRMCRILVLVVMVASYVFAISYHGSLVKLLLSAYGIVVQFAPGVYAAIYARRVPGRAILWGMLVGGAATVALILRPDWQPISLHPGLWGLALNAGIVAAWTWRRPAPSDERTEAFLATAEGEASAPPTP